MAGKAVISLTTGLEDTEKVTARYEAAGGQYYVCPICSTPRFSTPPP